MVSVSSFTSPNLNFLIISLSVPKSWPIAKKVRDEKIKMTAIVIIGDVIKPKSYEYSKLYDKSFSHGFRKAKKTKKKE